MKKILFSLALLATLPTFGQGSTRTVNTLSQLLAIDPRAVGVNSNTVYSVLALDANNPYPAARIARNWRGTAYATNYANVYAAVDGTQWVFDDKTDSEQNVIYWQAKPGDSTDDTAQIQAAMNSGAKKIVIPNGRFDISGQGLYMSNVVWLTGLNRHGSTFYYNGTNYCLTVSSGTTNSQNVGPRISELFFFGRSDVYTNTAGLLQITRSTRGTVERCNFSWDRGLGYPVPNSKNIFLNEQGWIWKLNDNQIGYADTGVYMQSTNPVGSIISAVEINGGEIFGNRFGILTSYTNLPSSTIGNGAYRLLANIWIKGTTIEANGAYGIWLNGVEQASIEDIYTEANGHLYQSGGAKYFTNELRSADIVLGNPADTSTNYSVGSVRINGIRFADSTNGIVAYSGKYIDIANSMVVGGRGTNFVFSPNVRNVTVWENNNSASQSSGYPTVHDPGNVVAYRRQSTDSVTGAPIISQTARQRFGDFDLSDVYWSADRAFYMEPVVSVQTITSNNTVGFDAINFGRAGYPRVGVGTDGTNALFLSKTETAGASLPISFNINGTEQARIETNTARFRGNVTVHGTNQVENLSVDGSIAAGSPPIYTGALSGAPTYRISINSSNNTTETLGYVLYSKDGTYNPSAIIKLDPTVGSRELAFKMNYSSGGNIPIRFYSPVKGILGEFYDPSANWTSLRVHLNGALEEVRWDPTSHALYAGVSYIPSGGVSAGWNGVTNVGSVFQANLAAGANVTLSTNSTTGTITIASTGGGGGPTNGSALYVDGTFATTGNFIDSAELNPTYSGTNVTYAIVANSIATNKIDSTFYNFVNNKQSALTFTNGTTNSAGIVSGTYLPGSNITFTTNAGAITIAAASGGGSTNGTPVYVNGVQPAAANFTNSTEITSVLTGTNVTHAIVANSIATNKIDATFYGFINGKQSALTFTNGVTNSAGVVQSALIAGSNITLSTNAGAITITGAAGGGLGTNIFVNNTKLQPAKLTNEPTATGGVIWITNAAGDIKAYATNLPSGGAGYLPLTAGSTVPLTGSLYFYPNATATQVILGNEQDVTSSRLFVGLQSAGGRFEVYDMTTNTYTVSQTLVSIDPTETVTNIFTFGTPGGKEDWMIFNAEKFEVNGTNVMALIDSKGTGGGGGTNRMIQTWTAAQAIPPTNSASIPAFLPKGNGIPYYCYDGATANQLGFLAKLPDTRNYASGIEIVLDVASDTAISTSNVVMQAQYQLLSPGAGTVETQNYTGAVLITNLFPGVAGVETNFTFTIPSWNTFTAGQRLLIDIQRVPGSASDTNSASKVCLGQVTMNTISP